MPVAAGSRVSYVHRGGLTEWYRNGPLGLEQGFTLRRRPSGSGALMLAVRSSGSLLPRLSGGSISFAGTEVARVDYRDLSAFDADRTPLPARLELDGRTIVLRVDDSGARDRSRSTRLSSRETS